MDREELLEREARSWAAFTQALERVPAERREQEGVVPGWSAHDLIWHCGYWAGWAVGQIDGTGDADDHDDAYWDDLNARILREARTMTWEESLARSERERQRARAALIAAPELTDEVRREFEGETIEHYEEHTAELEAFLAR
jgi:hypothetical protein